MKKTTFTKQERKTIVRLANAFLADNRNSQEDKKDMFDRTSFLLMAYNGYRGYNWIKWYLQGGASQFFKDYPEREIMTPELYEFRSQEKYMGLEYDRLFF